MRKVIILLMLLLSSVPALAQDNECYLGQFIIDSSTSPAKQKKELSTVENLTKEDIAVADETERAILVETEDAQWDPKDGEMDHGDIAPQDDVCRKLKKAIRKEKLENPNKIIHAPRTCDCNGRVEISKTPNDSLWNILWGLGQASGPSIGAQTAWDYTTGSKEVVVAVIDTGINYAHPDLAANMWRNPNEVAGNNIDDDGNGYVDDVYGINSITGTGNPNDDHGHGTHCAGTIGGVGNNGTGVVGVNWNVSLIGVKFLASNGSGSLFDAIESVEYVTNLKANKGVNIVVANNSWGGGGYISSLENAIRRMRDYNIVFAAAAGNNSSNNDTLAAYPSNYPVDNVVAVAAYASDGTLASFSNYGQQTVDIAAPGVNIASTHLNSGYVYMNGTSMATPHVAGAIALLSSRNRDLNYLQLIQAMYDGADHFPSLSGKVYDARALDIGEAVSSIPVGAPTATPTPPGPTATPTVTPTATNTPTATPTEVPQYFKIEGYVRSNNGAPISGAQVRMVKPDGSIVTQLTGSDGSYRFLNLLWKQHYSLSATKNGFTIYPSPYEINLEQDSLVNFEAGQSTYIVSAVLISRAKAPISGVSISAGAYGVATTDEQGRVRFNVPFGQSYLLSVNDDSIPVLQPMLSGIVYGDVERTFVSMQAED